MTQHYVVKREFTVTIGLRKKWINKVTTELAEKNAIVPLMSEENKGYEHL
ncbi:hypothetical protein [Neobacillus cucumis]|nr:hypothetical protein [Neobacillus cucumis]